MPTTQYEFGTTAAGNTHSGITDGHIIEADYYDNSRTTGSGSRVRYTNFTTTNINKLSSWPNADGYFYDAGGKQFKLIGDINVLMFGANPDSSNDDAPAFQAAITASNNVSPAIGGGKVHIPSGNYQLDATITLDMAGTSLRGGGSETVRLFATHTNGPAIRVKADNCVLENFSINSTGGRLTASAGNNYGILHEPDTNTTNAVVLCKYQDIFIHRQPSHAMVLCVGYLQTEISRVQLSNNKGHGILIDDGTEVGRDNTKDNGYTLRCGAIAIRDSNFRSNGGHGIKAGTDNSSVYRLELMNCDTHTNATDPNVRLNANDLWLILQSSNVELCGIGGNNLVGGIYIRGSSTIFRYNRFVGVISHAIHIDGGATDAISVEELLVVESPVPLNPAIIVEPGVTNVKITNQYKNTTGPTGDVTTLVTPGRDVDLSEEGYHRIPSGHNALCYNSGDTAIINNDDFASVVEFNGSASGVLVVSGNESTAGGALIHFRVNTSNFVTIISQTTANVFDTHNGIPTGTTGTPGKITVCTASSDNKIYIENRLGTTANLTVTLMSVDGNTF